MMEMRPGLSSLIEAICLVAMHGRPGRLLQPAVRP
jgi:hypothetical protein